MNLLKKQKEAHRLRKQTYGCWGRESQGVWDGHVHIAIFKMDNQQGIIVQHMELCCSAAAWMGEGFGGGQTHVSVWLSPFAVRL